jgi:ribosomal-protein-alanine N-acetyltransferase
MQLPGSKGFKTGAGGAGAHSGVVQVAPVSHLWLDRLVEIDASWNPKSWSQRLFEQELSNPAARVRGIFIEDNLVGYLIVHVVLDEAHIVSFGVDEAFRRRGLGRALLEDLLRIAKLERVTVVTLQVRYSNEAAQKLYRSVGFKLAGVRKRYYSDNGEDAITMRLELNRAG